MSRLLKTESAVEDKRKSEQALFASRLSSHNTEASPRMKKSKREHGSHESHSNLPLDCRQRRGTSCNLHGVNYTCVQVPGSMQFEKSDRAPSSDCLSGEYSWEVCSGGQFLCKRSPVRLRTGLQVNATISASKFASAKESASGKNSSINVPKVLKVYNLNIHPQQQRQWELVLSSAGMILTEKKEEAHVLIGNPEDRHACKDEGMPIVYGGSM